jgi:hypothetical protein
VDNVKWVIQRNNVIEEDKHNKLIETLRMYHIDYQLVSCVPFDNGPILVDNPERKKLIPYGSANFIQRCARQREFFVWSGPEFLEQKNQYLLNPYSQKMTIMHLLDICDNLEDRPYFVKPYDQFKPFAGQVLRPKQMKATFLTLLDKNINKEQLVQISEYKPIRSEYRFFVINYRVVTGSLYKHLDKLQNHTDQAAESLEIKHGTRMFTMAQDIVDREYMPAPCFVLDIARTDYSDTAKIIEFNVLNCSGFYSSNIPKMVQRLSNFVSSGSSD